jgi:hypothetical protein
MASDEPREGRSEPGREPIQDALGRLEERLDRASRAAERLLADAAERVTAAPDADQAGERERAADGESPKTPPAGWQQPEAETGRAGPPLLADAELLLGLFAAVRDRVPPDLQRRLAEAIREVLLALRALIDWYLERTDRGRSGAPEVQDIPIL